jgi:plasmid stabilization system protein ParE
MARTIRWTLAAVDDLDKAAAYVAQDSAAYAASLVRRVLEAARSLQDFAERGARVEELNDESVRERYVSGYRLIYVVRSETIQVLGVIHAARDFTAAWNERDRPL